MVRQSENTFRSKKKKPDCCTKQNTDFVTTKIKGIPYAAEYDPRWMVGDEGRNRAVRIVNMQHTQKCTLMPGVISGIKVF